MGRCRDPDRRVPASRPLGTVRGKVAPVGGNALRRVGGAARAAAVPAPRAPRRDPISSAPTLLT